jgi:hypothetical protein
MTAIDIQYNDKHLNEVISNNLLMDIKGLSPKMEFFLNLLVN